MILTNSKKISLLWDIDGTLIDTRGAGVKPLSNAIERVLNQEVTMNRDYFAGKTDYEIIDYISRDLTSSSLSNQSVEEILDEYVQGLQSNLLKSPVRVLGKVNEVLNEMAQESHISLGVLTGNCMNGGRVKLKSGQIFDYFDPDISFFATKEWKSRESLVQLAASQCDSVILIGDTPNDIEAARNCNQPIISISSGIFSFDELNKLNPGRVLEADFEVQEFTGLVKKLI